MKDIFRIGEIVVHKREGVSKIVSISLMCEKEYFVLETQKKNDEMIYVPVDMCSNVIRKIMSIEEMEQIFHSMKELDLISIPNAKKRRDYYKKLINSGEINDIALLSLQYIIYENGYKNKEDPEMHLGALDIDILKSAYDIFSGEVSTVFNISIDDVFKFVLERIN